MIRDIKTLADANIAIRELQDQIRDLTGNVIDFKKRRISNAGASINNSDYVIRAELSEVGNSVLSEISKIKTILNFLENRVKVLEP